MRTTITFIRVQVSSVTGRRRHMLLLGEGSDAPLDAATAQVIASLPLCSPSRRSVMRRASMIGGGGADLGVRRYTQEVDPKRFMFHSLA